jgi:hypothetical protein
MGLLRILKYQPLHTHVGLLLLPCTIFRLKCVYQNLTCVLAAVSPGPSSPIVGIDIYLQPLIEDLKRLCEGVVTYDISRKQNFIMKATLMWTINDFSAYGMLSRWWTGHIVIWHVLFAWKIQKLSH